MQDADAELFARIIIEAVKSGSLPVDVLDNVALHFENEARSYKGHERAAHYKALHNRALELLLRSTGSDGGLHQSWVEHRRRQMVLRTQWIENKMKGERDEDSGGD